MDDKHFEDLLNMRRVAVVHFSHHAVMGHKVTFPKDLHHAIENSENETRSCCALFPGHKMELPGSVGVIFSPKHSQVLSVCSSDSGSSDFGGEEGSMGAAPDEEAILESLGVPIGGYNEWRIRGALPNGIFVANPQCILAKQESIIAVGDETITDIGSVSISLQAVQKAFPSFSIYTMGGEGLENLSIAAGV